MQVYILISYYLSHLSSYIYSAQVKLNHFPRTFNIPVNRPVNRLRVSSEKNVRHLARCCGYRGRSPPRDRPRARPRTSGAILAKRSRLDSVEWMADYRMLDDCLLYVGIFLAFEALLFVVRFLNRCNRRQYSTVGRMS